MPKFWHTQGILKKRMIRAADGKLSTPLQALEIKTCGLTNALSGHKNRRGGKRSEYEKGNLESAWDNDATSINVLFPFEKWQ